MRVAYYLNPQNYNQSTSGVADFTVLDGRSPELGEVVTFEVNDTATKYIVAAKKLVLNSGCVGEQTVESTDLVLLNLSK